LLLAHYRKEISGGYLSLPINKETNVDQVKLVDSTTLSLFTDVFKGAGRNPTSGKKKGGLKAHAVLPLDNMVPELDWPTAASTNDKDFLGQLNPEKGSIYMSLTKEMLTIRCIKNGQTKDHSMSPASTKMRSMR
jgi:hypothetical protein